MQEYVPKAHGNGLIKHLISGLAAQTVTEWKTTTVTSTVTSTVCLHKGRNLPIHQYVNMKSS